MDRQVINIVKTEVLRPDDTGSAEIYSRLGYTLSEAISDLVDNSIDAAAKNILIRFIRTKEHIKRVLIIDDGHGMSDMMLSQAMQIGKSVGKTKSHLGKYGIGLKAASLNQAGEVSVISMKNGNAGGRRWTNANIKKGWICEVLDQGQSKAFLNALTGPVLLKNSGTAIIWEDLQHLKTTSITIDVVISQTIRTLSIELGLHFHRFIEQEKLTIFIDAQQVGEDDSGVSKKVLALNPFSYPASGHSAYPKTFEISLQPYGILKAVAHIWPPKSKDSGYRLGGGKISSRQGNYIYRNDRLIQVGGWNGSRDDNSEPHLSLARLVIELPPEFDSTFQLDVTKSKVDPPPEFAAQLLKARKSDGSTFKQYVLDAYSTYRQQKSIDGVAFKFSPGRGFPPAARDSVRKILKEHKDSESIPVDFVWKKLDPDIFVEIDYENRKLILNNLYRERVLGGMASGAADAPLIKLLIFLLMNEHLDRKAKSEKYNSWITKVNLVLIATCNKSE